METMVFDKGHSTYLVNAARIVRGDLADFAAETQASWAVDKSNPFVSWIAGDFVESDNANSNTQFWTAGDLAMSEYTIRYAPLNMIHKFRQPIGFFAATRTVSLEREDDSASLIDLSEEDLEEFLTADDLDWGATPSGANAPYKIFKVTVGDKTKFAVKNNIGETKATFDTKAKALDYLRALYASVPGAAKRANKVKYTGKAKQRIKSDKADLDISSPLKIQALSGLWTHIFPFEAAQAEAADDAGLLFYSMECRGSKLRCETDESKGLQGCNQEFDYLDVENHCEHLLERSSVRHIIEPTFRGGALIVPPVRPGWKNASASILGDAVMQEAAAYAEQNESQYNALNAAGADLSASAWEHLMTQIVSVTRS